MTTHPRFEKAEKRFLAVSLLTIALFVGMLLWWGQLNTLPEIDIPTSPLPSPNAFDDYKKAAWLMVASPLNQPVDPVFDSKEVPRKDWPKVYPLWRKEAWLRQNAPSFQAFNQGLKNTYQEPAARSFAVAFPHYARFREMARMRGVAGSVRAERGDWQGAAQIHLDTLQFGHQMPRGGVIITALVGYAIQSMARRRMPEIVAHLDAPNCRAAARRIEQIDATRVPFAQILQEEKWCGQAGLLEIMRQRNWAQQIFAFSPGTPSTNLWEKFRYRFVTKRRVLTDYSNYMDAAVASAKQPYAKAQTPKIPDGIVGVTLAPDIARPRFNDARSSAGNLLLAAALALRAYKLEQGTYPEKIAQLVPSYLSNVPADPFGGGETLRYKKTGDKYLLWSIGPDKTDDGGKAIDKPLRRPNPRYDDNTVLVQPDSQGDWVYGKNR